MPKPGCSSFGGQRTRPVSGAARPNDALQAVISGFASWIGQAITDGTLPRPEIQTFPLDDAARALVAVAGGHTRGKLVITI